MQKSQLKSPGPSEVGTASAGSPGPNAALRFLQFRFRDCPKDIGLGVLGKKWTLALLRDIGAYKIDRFNRLLESEPGIAPKVLATRLRELERAGILERRAGPLSPKGVRWILTARGHDAMAILLIVAAYMAKYQAAEVFDDRKPRKLHEFLDAEGLALVRSFF